MEILFLMMTPFVLFPPLAFGPAALFAWLYARCRTHGSRLRWLVFAAAAFWLVYAIYEAAVYFWSKTVVAPIRIDVLLLSPALSAVTLIGVFGYVFCRRRVAA